MSSRYVKGNSVLLTKCVRDPGANETESTLVFNKNNSVSTVSTFGILGKVTQVTSVLYYLHYNAEEFAHLFVWLAG